ncbi:MAG: adenosylmethionine decarboxylase [Planctomycetes bacterium]|nr:adenosylmethionine decarboxylase [Planctomycetota bacterium]
MAEIHAGIHCILELCGCPNELLNDELFVCEALKKATRKSLSTLLQLSSHKFEPQGVTAIGLLAESHISIHTWPEQNYAAVDIFTCGDSADPEPACEYLIREFQAQQHHQLFISRGEGAPRPFNTLATALNLETQLCPAPDSMPICGSMNI